MMPTIRAKCFNAHIQKFLGDTLRQREHSSPSGLFVAAVRDNPELVCDILAFAETFTDEETKTFVLAFCGALYQTIKAEVEAEDLRE